MTPKQQYYETVAKTVIHNLEKRNMEGYYCPDSASAVQKAMELMPKGCSIGWGGSETIREIGLLDALQQENYRLIDRLSAETPAEKRKLNGEIFLADYFLMSTNAITLEGELVNIDGYGSRVGFLCFGPEKVLVLCGMNKLVPDVEFGIQRVRNMASPPNTVRLHRNTPCAVTGRCGDCYGEDCICSQIVLTRRSGVKGRIQVILIGEALGY